MYYGISQLILFLRLSDGELALTCVTGGRLPSSWIVNKVSVCLSHVLLSGQKVQVSPGWWSVSAWCPNPFSVIVEYPSCVCSELYSKYMVCLYW
jgi:hypothetical protein